PPHLRRRILRARPDHHVLRHAYPRLGALFLHLFHHRHRRRSPAHQKPPIPKRRRPPLSPRPQPLPPHRHARRKLPRRSPLPLRIPPPRLPRQNPRRHHRRRTHLVR